MLRSILLVSTLTYSLVNPLASRADTVPCPAELEPIRAIITEAIEGGSIPGVAIMISREGETLWAEGFGYADIANQRKATADSVFLLASVSKPITATGLMTLVDAGKIDLDRSINDYLPNTKVTAHIGDVDDITVRRVAHHTGGFGTHYTFFYDGPPPTMDETITRFGHAVYAPGERYNYSNLGYGLLEYITQVVSGEPWGEYIERTVYDPLGMTGTSDHVRPERLEDRAEIYVSEEDGTFEIVSPYDFDHRGASAVWSTAKDLTRFLQMHINGGELDGARILSHESAQAMVTAEGQNAQYGLGWAVPLHRTPAYFDHTGGMPGVSTIIAAWPEQKTTLVLLTNTSGASIIGPVTRMTEELLVPPVERTRPPRQAGPDDLTDFHPKGTWVGHIDHFDGPIPITLTIRDSDVIHVALGDSPARALNRASTKGSVRGQTEGSVRVQDEYADLSRLTFNLAPIDHNTLRGTTGVSARNRYMTTLYTELTRER